MSSAEKVARGFGLEFVGGGAYGQSDISNDELIERIQSYAVGSYHDGEDELFVFSDGSCINRVKDEYFISDNVNHLDSAYLSMVGYS